MNKIIKKNRKLIAFIGIIVAAVINAFATKLFLVPAGLLPSGTSAMALLLQKLVKATLKIDIFYYWIFLLINAPILVWGYIKLSKNVVYKTIINVLAFTLVSFLIPKNLHFTKDVLVNALSGGILLGISNVILLYFGAAGTGLDLIGLYVNSKFNANIMGKINVGVNIFLYLIYIPTSGYNKAFLSFVSTLVNSQITDRLHVNSRYVLLLIVTHKANLINEYIVEKARRGDIIIDSVGGYSQKHSQTIITAISKHKFNETIKHLKVLDPNIYTIVLPTEKIIGRMKSRVGQSNI